MLETAEKQNSLLKKFIKTTKESENNTGLKVDQKIAIQLKLDIDAYGKELKKFNVDPENFPPFMSLSECYQANLPENLNE